MYLRQPESGRHCLHSSSISRRSSLFQIIDIPEVKVSPEKKRELQKPLSTDPQALFYMFSGLDSSDRGDLPSLAEAGYKKALERDPGPTPAKDARRLFRLKLVTPKKGAVP